MKPRSVAAIGILGAWGAGLALFAQRELSRPETDRLAEVAMRVVPGVTWFAVERDGGHVGFASVTIDTVPRELQVTEYLVVEGPDRVRRLEQTTVRLSRGLALHAFASLGRSSNSVQRLIDDCTDCDAVEDIGRGDVREALSRETKRDLCLDRHRAAPIQRGRIDGGESPTRRPQPFVVRRLDECGYGLDTRRKRLLVCGR